MPNCATIKAFLRKLLPPVKENPFLITPIICVPDKTNAGYNPAKKLTNTVNSINAIMGIGCNKMAALNHLPVILLK